MAMQTQVGIPGTIDEATRQIRWQRGSDRPSYPGGPMARTYTAQVPDGRLAAIVSKDPMGKNGRQLWHISVSHAGHDRQPDRVPTWNEIKHAVYRLVPEDVPMVMIFPRRSMPAEHYVNDYETCLHLWQSTEEHIDQP